MSQYKTGQKVFVKGTETWSNFPQGNGWYTQDINLIGVVKEVCDATGNCEISLPVQVYNRDGEPLMVPKGRGASKHYTRVFDPEEFYPIPDTPPVVDKEYESLLV